MHFWKSSSDATQRNDCMTTKIRALLQKAFKFVGRTAECAARYSSTLSLAGNDQATWLGQIVAPIAPLASSDRTMPLALSTLGLVTAQSL